MKTNTPEKPEDNIRTMNGLRRTTGNSAGFTIEEYNNLVVVKPGRSNSFTDFEIQATRNSSLKLSSVNNEEIYAENVTGEFELTYKPELLC